MTTPKTRSLRRSRKAFVPVKNPARRHQKKRIEQIAVGRTNLFSLKDWRHAELAQELIEGKLQRLNVREDMGDIFDFANSLVPADGRKEGILEPLRGYMGDNGKFQITDGERRWRGAKILSQRNIWIPIPVIREPQNYTGRERNLDLLRTNNGKPLSMIEQARAMQRLRADGMNEKEIAKSAGYSATHVADCLALIDAPEEIKEAVTKGELSGTTAADLTRRVPDPKQQVAVLEQGRAAAKQKGKKKITAKHLPVKTGKKAQAEKKETKAKAKSEKQPQLSLGASADRRPPASGAPSVPASAAVKKLDELRDACPRDQSVPSRYETLEFLTDYLSGSVSLTQATKFILGIG